MLRRVSKTFFLRSTLIHSVRFGPFVCNGPGLRDMTSPEQVHRRSAVRTRKRNDRMSATMNWPNFQRNISRSSKRHKENKRLPRFSSLEGNKTPSHDVARYGAV